LVHDGHLAKIPETLSFEETATLGVGITTVGQALYMTMKLPLPNEKPIEGAPFILIYGGSTATGTLAIQFAKL
jgi:NADPH:quinone reductase-like Zn-dependent oxidoreductase